MIREISFRTPDEKIRWLDGAARLDALLLPRVRAAGIRARAAYPDELARARAIFERVQSSIVYTRERSEEFADADQVIVARADDCDGMARLFVALALAAGLRARVAPVVTGGAFVHAQAEVWAAGRWWLCDPTIAVPFGSGVEMLDKSARRSGP